MSWIRHWTTSSACKAPTDLIVCKIEMTPDGLKPNAIKSADDGLQIGSTYDRQGAAILRDINIGFR